MDTFFFIMCPVQKYAEASGGLESLDHGQYNMGSDGDGEETASKIYQTRSEGRRYWMTKPNLIGNAERHPSQQQPCFGIKSKSRSNAGPDEEIAPKVRVK